MAAVQQEDVGGGLLTDAAAAEGGGGGRFGEEVGDQGAHEGGKEGRNGPNDQCDCSPPVRHLAQLIHRQVTRNLSGERSYRSHEDCLEVNHTPQSHTLPALLTKDLIMLQGTLRLVTGNRLPRSYQTSSGSRIGIPDEATIKTC